MIKTHSFRSFSGRTRATCLLALAILGCHNSPSSTNNSAADKAKQNFTVIRAGHPPFSTIITQTGRIEVVDFNQNHNVIVKKTKVQPNTLITVNASNISINTTTVSTIRLDRTHTYEIRLYQ